MKILIVLLTLLLTSCAPKRDEDIRPAPSGSQSHEQAVIDGYAWARRVHGRSIMTVADTSSMAPVLDSRTVLLVEPSNGTDLKSNDIAIWQHNSGTLIVHRVIEVNARGYVLFNGDNNHGSDGWVAPEKVRFRVVGLLFSAR